MAASAQCELFLLRYVPDALKEEFINIGVVLVQTAGAGPLFADVRFTSDWERVRCLDPYADVEMLQNLESDMRQRLHVSATQWNDLRRQLEQSFSGAVQLTAPKACEYAAPSKEIDDLASSYLESRPRAREASRPGPRRAVLTAMKDAFAQAGVWQLMTKDIAIRDYISTPDPQKIDCAYENGRVKMFHAIALEENATPAKALAFSFSDFRAALEARRKKPAELTAICAHAAYQDGDSFTATAELLRRSNIQLATTADLPSLAAQARQDLRL